MPTLLLLGAGGHARACIDVIELERRLTIGGLVGLPKEVGSIALGYTVLGTDADVLKLLASFDYAVVVVGQIKTPDVRMNLFSMAETAERVSPAIVSPMAYVSPHASVGAGSIVMHGAIVNAGAMIGRNCIINSLSLVEHDAEIADHCHVATGARINSGVRVGAGTFIGSGVTVRQSLVIGERCVIGMGQHVLTDCAAGTQLPQRQALT